MDEPGKEKSAQGRPAEVPPASAAGRPTALDESLTRLRGLMARQPGLERWSESDLLALPDLYRRACTQLARLEQVGDDPNLLAETRALVGRAHGVLFRAEERAGTPWPARLLDLVVNVSPRAIRAEWRLLACSFALFYGLALVAWVGVRRDLDLAYTLFDAGMVEKEMEQLAATEEGEPFRGNFTFGIGESPVTAGMIMLNNIGVGILFFASALFPPAYLYLFTNNALMLGTYTAVAGHWGQAGSISSILWTHGVIEIQTLVLVGTAGLVLVRAWVRPGARSRAHALVMESRRALELFAPVFPLLVLAGLIEGFVSPHAPQAVRLAVAISTGLALVTWVATGGRNVDGRESRPVSTAPRP